MRAYEAYLDRKPASLDYLLGIVREFAFTKVCHLEYDFRKFGSAETADDWAQDICLNVWQGLEKFTGTPEQFYSWVHKIAFNQATDSFNLLNKEQRTKVNLTVPVRDEHGTTDELEENPAIYAGDSINTGFHIPASVQGIDLEICHMLLTEIRDQVTGKHRARNYAEVGKELNLSEGAVRNRMSKLGKRLRAEKEAERAENLKRTRQPAPRSK